MSLFFAKASYMLSSAHFNSMCSLLDARLISLSYKTSGQVSLNSISTRSSPIMLSLNRRRFGIRTMYSPIIVSECVSACMQKTRLCSCDCCVCTPMLWSDFSVFHLVRLLLQHCNGAPSINTDCPAAYRYSSPARSSIYHNITLLERPVCLHCALLLCWFLWSARTNLQHICETQTKLHN